MMSAMFVRVVSLAALTGVVVQVQAISKDKKVQRIMQKLEANEITGKGHAVADPVVTDPVAAQVDQTNPVATQTGVTDPASCINWRNGLFVAEPCDDIVSSARETFANALDKGAAVGNVQAAGSNYQAALARATAIKNKSDASATESGLSAEAVQKYTTVSIHADYIIQNASAGLGDLSAVSTTVDAITDGETVGDTVTLEVDRLKLDAAARLRQCKTVEQESLAADVFAAKVIGKCTGNTDASTDVNCASGDDTTAANTENKGAAEDGSTPAECCRAVTVTGKCTGNTDASTDVNCASGDDTTAANTENKGADAPGSTPAECCQAPR